MKSVHIRSYSRPYFPSFGLNTERYSVSLRIQSECGKIRTRITLSTDTFYAVEPLFRWSKLINFLEKFQGGRLVQCEPLLIFVKYIIGRSNKCTHTFSGFLSAFCNLYSSQPIYLMEMFSMRVSY